MGALVSPLSRARRGARKRGWNIVCGLGGGDVQRGLNWGRDGSLYFPGPAFFRGSEMGLGG